MLSSRRVIFLVFLSIVGVLAACDRGDLLEDISKKSSVAANTESPKLESQVPPWPSLEKAAFNDRADEAFIKKLLASMSIEQKIGQMIQAEIRSTTPEDVKKYHLGSVLNGGGAFPNNDKYASLDDWLTLADAYYEASISSEKGRTPIPLIWGTDAVHGHNNVIGATLFPHNVAIGATRNIELARRIAEATAREVAASGIDWTFAPTLAVSRDVGWGRTYESFSQDVDIVSNFAGAFVYGFQGGGEEFLDEQRVLATAKHFIADGATEHGDDQGNALLSEEELRIEHAPPYFDAIEAGVQTVMISYSSVNGKKMHSHKTLITDVLKGELGFDGFVISDWNGIAQVPGCATDNCPQAVNAGIDMLMVPQERDWKGIISNLLAQVKSGEISMERVDDAVTRILRVKMRAGLISLKKGKAKAKPSARVLAGKKTVVGAKEHRALARQAVRESLVLFKNEANVLPISRESKVFIGGSAADSLSKQTGGWTISWQGTQNTNNDFPGATSVTAAIKDVISGEGVVTTSENAIDAAGHDVAIVVFGESPYAEFKGDIQNLNTIDFTETMADDLKLIQDLKKMNIPTVAIFFSGRPLWVNPVIELADAFVAAWLPGSEAAGISDVLFKTEDGAINHDFRGRLSFQWPLSKCHRVFDKRLPSGSSKALAIGFGLSYGDESKDLMARMASNKGQVCEQGISAVQKTKIPFSEANGWQKYGELSSWKKIPVVSLKEKSKTIEGLTIKQEQGFVTLAWNGKAKGKFSLASASPANLLPYLQEGYALEVKLRIDSPLSGDVMLGVECGAPCQGEINVAEHLSTLRINTWHSVYVDLSCFAKAKVDMHKINSILTLSSDKKAMISLGEVSLASADEAPSRIQCPF